MRRRRFLALAGAGLASAAGGAERAGVQDAAPARRSLRFHVGCQRGPTTPEMLSFFKRHGVDHICGYPEFDRERGYWTREDLERTRELCERHGVALDLVALPFLKSSHVDREERAAIVLGKDPERQRDVDAIHKMVEACARAGVPAFKYNLSILGVLRTARTPGRGGSRYSTWRLGDARPERPLTRAGAVGADLFWERIAWFLDRVIPVCEEHRIRAACHPHDPGVPPSGYQGVVRVLGTVDGLKRFVSMRESPYHGLNLCLGTAAEMLAEPRREIHEVIRHFGERGKIFNIHFRNIRGRRDDFREVYPDEGDLDMLAVARTLREVDYAGMLMPDHMPSHGDDPDGLQAFAFGYGYIKAIVQALAAEHGA
jgi:mannonate dehydratase